jgi:protein-S-isoprenylcysteine O-methyltransferase Ste14
MGQDFSRRPNRLPWPPMIYGAAAAFAWGLERLLPFRAFDSALGWLPVWIGWALIALALAIDLAAFVTMRRAKTTIMPNAASDNLVTSGIFGLSRNPIYVANTLLILGLAVWLRWGWLVLLAPVCVAAVTELAIKREERHLEIRFGDAYRDYKTRVRRWL